MVFKVVANATPLYVAEMWKSPDTHSENVTVALDSSSTFPGHYKNRLVLSQNWNTFNPKQVGKHRHLVFPIRVLEAALLYRSLTRKDYRSM